MQIDTSLRAALSRASATFLPDLLGLGSLVATLVVGLSFTSPI